MENVNCGNKKMKCWQGYPCYSFTEAIYLQSSPFIFYTIHRDILTISSTEHRTRIKKHKLIDIFL